MHTHRDGCFEITPRWKFCSIVSDRALRIRQQSNLSLRPIFLLKETRNFQDDVEI